MSKEQSKTAKKAPKAAKRKARVVLDEKAKEFIKKHAKIRGVESKRGEHDMTLVELAEKFDVSTRTIFTYARAEAA